MLMDKIISLMSYLALVFLVLLPVKGAPIDAEVKQFPGFDGELPSKHYAGYITVSDHAYKRYLYCYFATSERNPMEDPITLWINGGPGCAGLDALLCLIGPFKLEPELVHFNGQPKVSSIIVVDSPAGTGYSNADTTDYTTNDTRTVSDLYEFVIKWFSEYPEFLPNPFYLAGCSYSGVLVPVLAQEVVKGVPTKQIYHMKYINIGIESDKGPKLNFKGYSLGNAAMNLDIESSSKVPFAHRMGLIPDEQYEDLVYSCEGKYFGNSNPDCLRNLENFQWHIKDINKDQILCLPCHFTMGNNMVAYKYDSFRTYESIHGETQYSPYCHEYEMAPKRLLDLETSRQILHAMPAEVSGP